MANTIALAKNYISILDEVYKNASVTADLTSDNTMVRAGANANEIVYPQIAVSGLGDYSRNSGYTNGSVNLEWKTAQFNYDRGTKISVDVMDNEESRDIAFTMAGSELMRTKVAPEADAFTFATLAGIEGISKAEAVTYADAVAFLAGLIEAKNKMDEDEVPEEGRILYATPTLLNGVIALDTTKSREVLNSFAVIKKVPQSRFYTAIDLLSGGTGEEIGGYVKHVSTGASDAAGADINFMIVHPSAVVKFSKRVVGNVIPPELNADSDGYILKFREYDLVDVFENKVKGVYVHSK